MSRPLVKKTSKLRHESCEPSSYFNFHLCQHSLRVYHQVQAWKSNVFSTKDWGWAVEQGQYKPVTPPLPPASDNLLHLVRCGCKGDCTRNEECKRSGMTCTTMCSECPG
ncbi:hypothetical protein PR048_024290 [Dryococelus australis]|uniref:WAP domain-containing protein n=1 Tax=Dryococelus australis TaxID=614101 RepID=A0ABQ9GN91_9NEOP|nr:hypothetical protein PR048_024290 [Dryococelus australis]